MTTFTSLLVFAFPDEEQASAAFVQLVQLHNRQAIDIEAAALVVKTQGKRLALQGVAPSRTEHQEIYDTFVSPLIDICLGQRTRLLPTSPPTPESSTLDEQTATTNEWHTIATRMMQQDAVIIVRGNAPVAAFEHTFKPFAARVV